MRVGLADAWSVVFEFSVLELVKGYSILSNCYDGHLCCGLGQGIPEAFSPESCSAASQHLFCARCAALLC